MSEVVIRRARNQDVDVLLALWHELMTYHANLDPRFAPVEDAREVFRDTMAEWIDARDKHVVVAAAGNRPIGYAIGSIVENAPILRLQRFGHISDICVAPEWRRQGIGRRLFGALRKWFRSRGLAVVQLSVYADNAAGQAFWREMGFDDYMTRLWLDI